VKWETETEVDQSKNFEERVLGEEARSRNGSSIITRKMHK
jgi:hypothetical protein